MPNVSVSFSLITHCPKRSSLCLLTILLLREISPGSLVQLQASRGLAGLMILNGLIHLPGVWLRLFAGPGSSPHHGLSSRRGLLSYEAATLQEGKAPVQALSSPLLHQVGWCLITRPVTWPSPELKWEGPMGTHTAGSGAHRGRLCNRLPHPLCPRLK